MILALAGCGFMPFGNKDNPHSPAPPPPSSEMQAQPPLSPSGSAAMSPPMQAANITPAAPAQDGLAGYVQVPPKQPVPAAPPEPVDPVLAAGPLELGADGAMGSLGLNLEDYFGEADNNDTRITKIERVVTAMQRDLRTLAPPLIRLIGVEQDIQELVTQLSQLAQNQSPPGPMAAAYNAAPLPTAPPAISAGSTVATPPPQAPPPDAGHSSGGYKPPSASGPVTVHKLRLGEHPDKTRIVLDVSGAASYRYDLDNAEHLLVIELPDASWSGETSGQPGKSPTLASWTVYPMDGGGSRVVMQLKKDTAVSYETVIKPNGYSDYRIVIDLGK